MSTHKNIERICVIAVVIALILTGVLMSCDFSEIIVSNKFFQYETRLFDTEKVHTIDIYMDDWDSFIASCQSEEYSVCDVIIDGETFQNIAIRGKGNTSLSNVSSMDSDRYSFKIEFDHYSSGNSYYGLDKLSLNNVIQDNTYMKDYLTYRLMNEFDVAAPLCSFTYITVNGEDWGLYLAVEGIEDAFLQRNYGNDYGELYKPDSMSFGGGRGNGKDFDMDKFMNEDESADTTASAQSSGNISSDTERMQKPENSGFSQNAEMPDMGEVPDINEMPDMGNIPMGGTRGDFNFSVDEETLRAAFKELGLDEALLEGIDFENITMETVRSLMSSVGTDKMSELMEILMKDIGSSFGDMEGKGGAMGGMGSSDVKLQYIDDDPDSYSNIFDNAKTDITSADKTRLIESLKALSEGENIESVVDVEAVIRYFAVHNFVCNGDSYTGSMIHNYYLYEKDSQMSMIPWDYNLAFGTFQSSSATSTVNSPIDTPVSGSSDDRPMIDWIFDSENYTAIYHEYFSEFLENVDIQSIILNAQELISPYVEKDPTKFCTYEEFTKGVETLKEFCKLRSESVSGQLSGSVPSTTAGQSADSSALIDASHITISDMGSMSMGGGFGGNKGERPDSNRNNAAESTETTSSQTQTTTEAATTQTTTEVQISQPSQGGEIPQGGEMPQMPEGGEMPQMPEGGEMPQMPEGMENGNMQAPPDGMTGGRGQRPDSSAPDMTNAQQEPTTEPLSTTDSSAQLQEETTQPQTETSASQTKPQRDNMTASVPTAGSILSSQGAITILISLAVLVIGLIFALGFKRRKDG